MAANKRFRLLLLLHASLVALSLGASELIDPTRPSGKNKPGLSAHADAPPGSWALESTLVAPDRRVAVINGKLVSEGESIDGARVIEIRKLDVLVETPERRMTLYLLPDIVKRSP